MSDLERHLNKSSDNQRLSENRKGSAKRLKRAAAFLMACLMVIMALRPGMVRSIYAETVDSDSPYLYFDNSLSEYDKMVVNTGRWSVYPVCLEAIRDILRI